MPAGGSYKARIPSGYDDMSTPMKQLDSQNSDVPASDAMLPLPAIQSLSGGALNFRRKRRPRFKESTMDVVHKHLERLRRKFGTGTAPSESVDIEAESVAEPTDVYGFYMRSSKKEQLEQAGEVDEVDEVVVDREWGDEVTSSGVSDYGEKNTGNTPMALGAAGPSTGLTDADSIMSHHHKFWGSAIPAYFRWRIWPAAHRFFLTQFQDEKMEDLYRRESWYVRKNLALWSSAFWILNWVVSMIFVPKPLLLADKIFHWAVAPVLTFPIFFMVLFNFPRDRRLIYQITLTLSTWMWSIFQIVVMFMCAYYGHRRALFSCGSKDFLATFYYANGPQVIALFGLGLERFPALVGMLTFMSLAWGMIVPDRHTWSRNVINFFFFQLFLLYIHYMRENAERRLYTLRDQLKVQFRATQKAQVNERKAADSKRRLTSYVFHEVRVPLNTALLAVQNMAASGCVAKDQQIEFKALEGSLSMMSKVLNDVLDFNRMDSGRFENVLKPYSFHQVMRSMFVPLRMATDARGLTLVTDLDRRIDDVARRVLYEALGDNDEEISRKLQENADEDGVVVGDETRLRQIITNLASNACKFTPAGGKLLVTTRLIHPYHHSSSRTDSDTLVNNKTGVVGDAKDPIPVPTVEVKDVSVEQAELSRKHLARHDSMHTKSLPLEWVVVRIEVTDTGCGIRPKDMVECKLFSAFNQTDLGRQQGGKGTGLGLALVRQIVKMSGGRLGVHSKAGSGSTFWVELPLGVGSKATSYFTTPQFFLQTETPHNDTEFLSAAGTLNVTGSKSSEGRIMSSRRKLSRTQSAMHTIMDQGGPVEISTDDDDDGRMLTRMIGDSSTGTDPTPTVPLTTPSSSPASTLPRPPVMSEQPSDMTIRPNYVQLPQYQRFSIEELTADSPLPTPAGSTHSSALAWEPGLHVLVVDDDSLTRKLMARMLTRLGCKVSTAENGDIALELILGGNARPTPSSEDTGSGGLSHDAVSNESVSDEFKYSVVFLDNQMPVMSGLDMVAKLRESGRRDFVVGVTGNALLDDQEEYYAAGVDHVLTKPVQEKSLKAMLAIADERRKRGLVTSDGPEPPAPP